MPADVTGAQVTAPEPPFGHLRKLSQRFPIDEVRIIHLDIRDQRPEGVRGAAIFLVVCQTGTIRRIDQLQ